MIKRIKEAFYNPLVGKSISVLALRSTGVLLLFSLTLFITNNFDQALVGQYDLSRSVLIIVGTITVLGFNHSIIYFSGYLKAKEALGSIVRVYIKMLRMVLISALIIFLIYLTLPKTLINNFYEKEVYGLLLKTFGVLFFYSITILNIDLFRGINKIIFSEVLRNVFRHIFFLGAVILLHMVGKHEYLVDFFLFNFLFLAALTSIVVYISLRRIVRPSVHEEVSAKAIFTRSYPMSISVMSFLLMQNTDIILIGKFMQFEDVAHYAVAVKLTMIIALVLSSVNAVYAPKISELFSRKDTNALREHVKRATRLIFVFTIPFILMMLFFSDGLLSFFGTSYTNGSSALKILLVAQIVNALCGSVGMYMNMTNNERVFQRILLVSLVLNIILNWFLIPEYGLIGAASATAISTILWNVYGASYLFRKKKIKTFLH